MSAQLALFETGGSSADLDSYRENQPAKSRVPNLRLVSQSSGPIQDYSVQIVQINQGSSIQLLSSVTGKTGESDLDRGASLVQLRGNDTGLTKRPKGELAAKKRKYPRIYKSSWNSGWESMDKHRQALPPVAVDIDVSGWGEDKQAISAAEASYLSLPLTLGLRRCDQRLKSIFSSDQGTALKTSLVGTEVFPASTSALQGRKHFGKPKTKAYLKKLTQILVTAAAVGIFACGMYTYTASDLGDSRHESAVVTSQSD